MPVSPLLINMPPMSPNGNSLSELNCVNAVKNQKVMTLVPIPVSLSKASCNVKKSLKCIYFNACSVNKLDELNLYIDYEDADIIGVTETWLYEEISDAELNINDNAIF